MTQPVNYHNTQHPAYSGVTINISNPTMNTGLPTHSCTPSCYHPDHVHNCNYSTDSSHNCSLPPEICNHPAHANFKNNTVGYNNFEKYPLQEAISYQIQDNNNNSLNNTNSYPQYKAPQQEQVAYPPQYYLNNYNYINKDNTENINEIPSSYEITKTDSKDNETKSSNISENNAGILSRPDTEIEVENLDVSKEIINNLDKKVEEQKELEKNGKKTRIISLTDEYIKSLENYLNNPNTEIRLMAAKDILTRLDEDKTRFNDTALNALLNKMLQDPESIVRTAALSAFSSQLASGNDYTVQLLNNIQNNPNSNQNDVVQAADILLKMSGNTEIVYTPTTQNSQQEQQS